MMNKLHIGILTERMTMGYGVDLVIHEQAVRLIKMGYKVTVFPGWKTDLYDDQPYDIVSLAVDTSAPVHCYSLDFMHDAFEIINKHSVNVWIIHTPPFYFWLTNLPAPVIMVEHGTPPGKYFRFREGRFLDRQTRKRQQKIFRSTRTGDGLIAISEYIRSVLPDDVQKNTVVIHNGADHYPHVTSDQINKYRLDLGLEKSDVMVLWVGRIQPERDPQSYKGLAQFIRIAPEIIKANAKIMVIAAGKGDPSGVQILEDAGIKTILNVPREDMPVLYASADIFMNTSRWEGFNLPLAEAQFQNTPVVALNVCAHSEVVDDQSSGFLLESIEEIRDKVIELAQDRELREKMSNNTVLHISKFTWDNNVEKLHKLICDCVKVVGKTEETEPDKAQMKKNIRYYLDYGQYLIQRFGWKTLIKESFGWIKRRL